MLLFQILLQRHMSMIHHQKLELQLTKPLNKKQLNMPICQSHIFMPIAVETSGVWNKKSYGFIVDLGRKSWSITNDNRETSFLFQRLSIAIQRGNEICFTNSLDSVIQNGTDEHFFYCPDLVFAFYLRCPCKSVIDFNKEIKL